MKRKSTFCVADSNTLVTGCLLFCLINKSCCSRSHNQQTVLKFLFRYRPSTCCHNGLSVSCYYQNIQRNFPHFHFDHLLVSCQLILHGFLKTVPPSLMRLISSTIQKQTCTHFVLFVLQLLSVNFTVKINVWQKIKNTVVCESEHFLTGDNCLIMIMILWFWLFVPLVEPCFPLYELKTSQSNKQHSTVTWSIPELMPLTSLLQELQEFAPSTLSNTHSLKDLLNENFRKHNNGSKTWLHIGF